MRLKWGGGPPEAWVPPPRRAGPTHGQSPTPHPRPRPLADLPGFGFRVSSVAWVLVPRPQAFCFCEGRFVCISLHNTGVTSERVSVRHPCVWCRAVVAVVEAAPITSEGAEAEADGSETNVGPAGGDRSANGNGSGSGSGAGAGVGSRAEVRAESAVIEMAVVRGAPSPARARHPAPSTESPDEGENVKDPGWLGLDRGRH